MGHKNACQLHTPHVYPEEYSCSSSSNPSQPQHFLQVVMTQPYSEHANCTCHHIKTLATLRLDRAQVWKQLHIDETSRQQKSLVNVFISVLDSDGALKSIWISCSIIARDGTAEEKACAIIASFLEFKQLLDYWQ